MMTLSTSNIPISREMSNSTPEPIGGRPKVHLSKWISYSKMKMHHYSFLFVPFATILQLKDLSYDVIYVNLMLFL